MKFTAPVVRLIARPEVDWPEVERYLASIGASTNAWDMLTNGEQFEDNAFGEGQSLVEIAGRLCYRSWEPGLNPNVIKIREKKSEYLLNILESGHGSVLEHAQYSFIFENVSRVFTHEMVRHRVGTAISQESMRFVRLTDIPFWMPSWAGDDAVFMQQAYRVLETLETFQKWMADHFKLDTCQSCGQAREHPQHNDGDDTRIKFDTDRNHVFRPMLFNEKKRKMSFMRRFAPDGVTTQMLWSANIRTIRHVIERRTDVAAEEEMRVIIPQLAELMATECPLLFNDYVINKETNQWTTEYGKV